MIVANDNTVTDALGAAFRVRGKPESNIVAGNRVTGENTKEVIFDTDGN